MGQKVHPFGFRLGYNKNWQSRWYSKKEYPAFVREDFTIRQHVKKLLFAAGLAHGDGVVAVGDGLIADRGAAEVQGFGLVAECTGEFRHGAVAIADCGSADLIGPVPVTQRAGSYPARQVEDADGRAAGVVGGAAVLLPLSGGAAGYSRACRLRGGKAA